MALESKLLAVPQQTFTGNGTTDGQITIADPYLFKIGQVVVIGSPNIELQIKRIADGVIHVGPFDDNPDTRSDVSAYTVGSYIFANEQLRPWIPRDGVIPNFPKLDYTYEEAPTVAQRSMLVDKSGQPLDTVEVSGIRRLAVETSVSVSTTASGVQDVRIVEQPIAVTISGSPAVTVTGTVTTSGIAEQPVRVTNSPPVNIPSPLDVNVINSLPQHNVTVSGVVNVSGVVDFQRPLHVIVDSAPASVATISGIITTSGVSEQPVRIDHVVNVSGVVDFQRPVHVIVDSAPESVATISGIIAVSGVAEQPVRIDHVVRVSGIVDIQRPLDVNVISSTPVNIPEPLDVTVTNSLPQHNVTVSGIVNISGIVDFQRPVHVIVDSAPESVTTISGIIAVSGVSEQPVRVENIVRVSGVVDIQRPLDVNILNTPTVNVPEPLDVNVTNSLTQHNVTVSGVVNISGIVDFQRPLHVIVDNPGEAASEVTVINSLIQHNVTVSGISGTVVISGIAEQPVRIDSVVRISGIVDVQRPLDVIVQNQPITVSGVAPTFLEGITNFTRTPIFGSHLTTALSYTAPDLIEYVGWANPDTSKASAGWAIAKITYSGVSILDFQWAAGNKLFNKVWNDRVTYLYS